MISMLGTATTIRMTPSAVASLALAAMWGGSRSAA